MRDIEKLLHRGAGYDVELAEYATPDLSTVRQALAAGVDINCRDRTGTSALGHAAWHGEEQLVALLLERGADVDAENLDGATPLHMTVFNNQPLAAALLLAHGADPADAAADAESMGKEELRGVFDAWQRGRPHPLLSRARERAEQTRQKAEARSGGGAHEELQQRLRAALAAAAALEARNAELEAEVARLRAALEEKEARGRGVPSAVSRRWSLASEDSTHSFRSDGEERATPSHAARQRAADESARGGGGGGGEGGSRRRAESPRHSLMRRITPGSLLAHLPSSSRRSRRGSAGRAPAPPHGRPPTPRAQEHGGGEASGRESGALVAPPKGETLLV